jgi:hypothetical protein
MGAVGSELREWRAGRLESSGSEAAAARGRHATPLRHAKLGEWSLLEEPPSVVKGQFRQIESEIRHGSCRAGDLGLL